MAVPLTDDDRDDRRVSTGFHGVDRVLGGGLVPGSVVLVAGEPGIGKSTLLLHVVANLSAAGLTCLLASGEESRGQVSSRARRLGLPGERLRYLLGRDLPSVLAATAAERPDVLVVDSIQTLRDQDLPGVAGGPSQVRAAADALVGLAKEQGCAVVMVGHVTKDGDVAGPKTLEHAVDVVVSFEGEPRSGLRVLSGGKNRFGPEGEVAWFEMAASGLAEVDPAEHLRSGRVEPGAAIALPMAGRRAIAVEVQALSVPTQGPPRRQVAGLDPHRFGLIAAVLQEAGFPVGRAELYGAAGGGLHVDDPGADLAVAAALASASRKVAPPPGAAFVGEISLTGAIRASGGGAARLAAARAAGVSQVIGAVGRQAGRDASPRVREAAHVRQALAWAGAGKGGDRGTI